VASVLGGVVKGLAKGAARGAETASSVVYQLVDDAGDVVYYGLTNNPAVRVAQHGRIPPGPFRGMQVISAPLPLPQAQALETSLIQGARAEGKFLYNVAGSSLPAAGAGVAVPGMTAPTFTLLNPQIY
jgi:hypothetical protein